MNLGPHDWAELANTLKSVRPEIEVTDNFELKACGANKPGGGGFAAGNTCARGGSGGSSRSETATAATEAGWSKQSWSYASADASHAYTRQGASSYLYIHKDGSWMYGGGSGVSGGVSGKDASSLTKWSKENFGGSKTSSGSSKTETLKEKLLRERAEKKQRGF